jgi:hypothetical protein
MRHHVKMLITTVVIETHTDVSVRELPSSTGVVQCLFKDIVSCHTTVVVEMHNDVSVRELPSSTGVVQCLFKGIVSCFNSSSMFGHMDGRWITIGSHADAISLLYSLCHDRILLILLLLWLCSVCSLSRGQAFFFVCPRGGSVTG